MKKWMLSLCLSLSIVIFGSSTVIAGEVDVLVDLLVKKGILSSQEADTVLTETKRIVAQEEALVKTTASHSDEIPSWIKRTKINGDVRLRFQKEVKSDDQDPDKEGRIRVRVGVESKITDDVKVGVGIATAGSSNDPRSRNATLKDTFDSVEVELDYGYAEWQARENLKLVGGKFHRKPYLWLPTDMLWDGDITPEGVSANWVGNLAENTDYWINGGVWILDENGHADAADPFLKLIQGGVKYKEGIFDLKLATTFYDFQGIEDITLTNSKASQGSNNTAVGSSYTSISPAFEVGFKELFGGLPLKLDERIAFFGEYVRNLDDTIVTDELNGWSFGMKFGSKKVKDPGQWQGKYIKTKLQKDAWLDLLPDSDRFGGATGIEAHEFSLKYVLKKNIILGLDYYKSWETDDPANKQNLLQADLLFKF